MPWSRNEPASASLLAVRTTYACHACRPGAGTSSGVTRRLPKAAKDRLYRNAKRARSAFQPSRWFALASSTAA
jgi:hypothetical protein